MKIVMTLTTAQTMENQVVIVFPYTIVLYGDIE